MVEFTEDQMKGFGSMKRRYLIILISLVLATVMTASVLSGCGGDGKHPVKSPGATSDPGSEPSNTGAPADPGISDPQAAAALSSAKAGDKITFGKWEQDGKDGDEPVSWIVIEQHVGKALVLSEKILECDYFNSGTDAEPYQPALYKDSDVRAFLNGGFYEKAFSDSEKAMILATDVTTNYKDEYYNELQYVTNDKVFLLSRDEANKYVCGRINVFGIPTNRVQEAFPYEMSSISGVAGIEKAMSWWLRDMGSDSSKYAAYIYAAASQRSTYELNVWKRSGIRPAMWIVYNFADLQAYERGELEPKKDDELERRIAALKIGGTLPFGSYDRDPYSLNGYEKLEWTVVDSDEETLFIVANQNLTKMPFLKEPEGGFKDPVTWESSDIRKYINSDSFIDRTFTPQEKAKLVLTHVVTSGNGSDRDGGPATDDLLFILDAAELDKYFPENPGRGISSQRFWLRSPESWEPQIAFVESDGTVYSRDPDESYYIRLAARIKK